MFVPSLKSEIMKKVTSLLATAAMIMGIALFTTSCGGGNTETEEKVEEVQDEVEEGAEEMGDAVEEGAEEMGDAMEEGAEEMEDMVDSTEAAHEGGDEHPN
jgi:hypothetical protein